MFQSRILLVASLVLATSCTLSAIAAPVTVPNDLALGAQYRLAFVTSTVTDATSTDINTYNQFVTNVAGTVPELVALGTTWKAIASTAAVDARDNTGTNGASPSVPIYILNGNRIANNNADLWDGFLLNTLQTIETGVVAPGVAVWTGTDTDGTEFTNGTLGPPSGLGTLPQPVLGASNSFFPSWIVASTLPPTELHALFAMSGVLTVVPEPTSLFLVLAGAVAFAGLAARRTRAVVL